MKNLTIKHRAILLALIPTLIISILAGILLVTTHIGWIAATKMVLEEYQIIFLTVSLLIFGITLSIILSKRIATLLSDSPTPLKQVSPVETQDTDLLRTQEELHKANRIKSEFIANMSHEIRTPMNSIVGYTNLLLETDLSVLQRNYLTTIQKSTLNLLNLMNNILDFSRLDTGQLKLDYIPFDLHDCIEDILSTMSPLANSKHLEFLALIDENIPKKILSDPMRIKQIIINLVSNAIKFTDQGEILIHVSLEKETPKFTTLRIAVSDTGIGLSENDQKNIFQAFQQADTNIARKYGGTGLGLAICKKLIDQMAGKIGVESPDHKGSTFWFSFNAGRVPYDSIQEPNDINFAGCSAILYEPHTISRQTIKTMLTDWQINVMDFADLDQLIEYMQQPYFETHHLTFFIAGINHQYTQNGLAAKILQKIKERFAKPVIALTNSSEQAVLEYLTAQGATFSLSKPLIRKNLQQAISEITQSDKSRTLQKPALIPPLERTVDFSNKHILCVDDNPQNANLIKALLENSHAMITIAGDGIEALQLIEKQSFDIILMDIRMPKLDGYETLKLIRATQNKNSSTPVIAVSAHISDDEHEELIKTGFNGCLIKPIVKFTLLEAIKQLIMKTPPKPTTQAEPEDVPILDWNLGIKLAGNKKEAAEEMLNLLLKSLPADLTDMQQLKEIGDYPELLRRVHKLHGALCYCGTPRLKNAAAKLESALKQQKTSEASVLFEELEMEIHHLLDHATISRM